MMTSEIKPKHPSVSGDKPAVIVTGAAKRLGREIALGLARDGWDVVVHYNRSGEQAAQTVNDIQALGRRAVALPCDLADDRAVDAFFDAACNALTVRAIVNSASHFEYDSPVQFSVERLRQHLGPNLAAPLQLSKHLHEHLAADERGVVINILDQKLENLNPDFFSYTLSKYALLGAIKMMARAFAPKLRVVGVSPGLTMASYLQDEQAFTRAHTKTALLDHSSHPQDIVQAVVFLARQSAITGINLTVDGGQHLMGLPRDVSYLNFDGDPT